jgi:subtilase family serine protease
MAPKLVCKSTLATIALILLLGSLAFGQVAQQNRIVRAVENRSVVRLQGTVHPLARSAFDKGPASPTQPMQRMTLFFQPTAEQQAALDQLLAEQQDPASPNYHKWLTPEEFADRFGISAQDANTLATWLRSQGFNVDEIGRSRTWIAFSGIAAQVEAAFQTSIHSYLVGGKMHYAASSEPAIPAAFAGVVTGIGALHDFAPHARSVKARPRITSSLTGNHFIAPGDFATIYDLQTLLSSGINGSGQTIAIVGQTDLSTDSNPGRNGTPGAVVNGQQQQYDVVTFRNLAGLPALTLGSNFQIVMVPGTTDPGVVTADVDEANLDIEWAGATAPNASLVYVIENANSLGAFGALEWAVSNVKANVFSISYGVCETQVDTTTQKALTTAGQQANTQGQTIVAPSGDSGAADCDSNTPATHGLAVDFPGSLPTFTSMGGTTFSADSANSSNPSAATQYWAGSSGSSDPNDTSPTALAYIPEVAWNDTATTTPSISATGGGVSTFSTTKPTWQTGPGVPNDNARDVPDISFTSSPNHDGYVICSQSSCVNGYRNTDTTFDVIGGTSAPTPAFAGIVTLINQKLGSAQGNINPQLYTQATNAPWAFHDITSGNNIVACQAGSTGCPSSLQYGYSAGVGYDLVTGLGSPDVGTLINAITGVADFSVSPSSTAVTLSANSSTSLTLNLLGTSGSNITFACSAVSPLSATTCSAPSVTTNGGTAVTSTLSINSTGTTSQSGTINVTASNGSISHLVPVALTINGTNPDFSIASANGTETVTAGGTTTDTIGVTSLQGFSGSVSFSCSGTTGLSCSLSPNPVTASTSTVVTSTLTVTSSSTAPTGSITITATSGTIVHTLQILVTVSGSVADFTITSSPSSLVVSSGQRGSATITVAPVANSGFTSSVALSCTVTSSLGTTTCSLSPATVSGGSGTSTLTINAATLAMLRGAPGPFSPRGMGAYGTLVFSLGMVFTMKPRRRSSRGKAWRSSLLSLLLLGMLLTLVSCGGGSNNGGGPTPTPLNGTVTVTGNSGSLTHSVAIPVTIN